MMEAEVSASERGGGPAVVYDIHHAYGGAERLAAERYPEEPEAAEDKVTPEGRAHMERLRAAGPGLDAAMRSSFGKLVGRMAQVWAESDDLPGPDDFDGNEREIIAVLMDRAMPAEESAPEAGPYGYCPTCGEPGVNRERRAGGRTFCQRGHFWPSNIQGHTVRAEEAEPAPAPPVEVRVGQVWKAENGSRVRITKEHMAASGAIACFLTASGCTLVSDAPGAGEEPRG